jgi:hypothetical protein
MSDQQVVSSETYIARQRAEQRILKIALNIYQSPKERAALRGGLGDATALCDVIAKSLPTKDAAIAKLCGDAIWAMRAKITDMGVC